MSFEDQQRLTKCAGEMIDVVASEALTTPTAALVKVAQKYGLNRNEIQRIAETYNASAQLAQFKRAKDDANAEPDDLFDLADGEAASTEVLGEQPKAEGEKKNDVVDAEAFTKAASAQAEATIVPESTDFNALKTAGAYGNNYGSQRATLDVTKRAAAPPDVDQLERKASNLISQLKVAYEDLRDEVAAARMRVLRGVSKIATDLSYNTAAPWGEIEKHARSLHGDGMDLACRFIYKAAGLADKGHSRYDGELLKYASIDAYREHVADCLGVRDNLRDLVQKQARADEMLTAIEKREYQLRTAFHEKTALDPMSMALGKMTDLGKVDAEVEEQSMPAGKPNEELRTQLGHDRMSLMLSNMRQDPVISEFVKRPGAIEEAFNELATLQPNLLRQPVALRAALRRHLTSGGDFTVQEAEQVAKFPETKSAVV